jgi:signal transduction histidine kinase
MDKPVEKKYHTKSEKRLRELELLYEISSSMHTLNLNEILHLILEAVTKGIGFDRARLYVVDDVNHVLRLKMSVGLKQEEIYDVTLPLDKEKSIVARSFIERTPYVIQDARKDPRVNTDIVKLFNITSFAAVPLLARDKVKGVVSADNLYTDRIISAETLRSLVTFANHAGLAVENAEIYDRLKHFNQELEHVVKLTTDKLLKAQDELIRTERLAALGELAAGIAHEIRNPLTSIKILVNSLFSELPADLAHGQDVRVINGEIERLNTIIAQFLEFAKPQEPSFGRMDIKEVIHDTVSLAMPEIKKHHVRPFIDVSGATSAHYGDKRQLKQVILNLILNAVQAMPKGGELTITASVRKDRGKNLDTTEILIEDTGTGISPDNLKKLFTPFFSTKKDGVGLGLSIAQKIIEKHSGSIAVESVPDKGTTFRISLPVRN